MLINIPSDYLAMGLLEHSPRLDDAADCRRALNAYLSEIAAHKPAIVLLNVNYKRSAIQSDVFDTVLKNVAVGRDGFAVRNARGDTLTSPAPVEDSVGQEYFDVWFPTYRALLQNGIDIFQMALDFLRERGIQCWFSFRMNDHHYYEGHLSVLSDFVFQNLDRYAIPPREGVLPGQYLDYAHPQVRNRFREYILDLLARYDVDGIEMDWLRSAPLFSRVTEDSRPEIDAFMRDIRAHADKSVKIGARVKACEEENLADGLDAARWIAQGSLDLLTLSNYFVPTCFEFPVSQWRRSIAKKIARNARIPSLAARISPHAASATSACAWIPRLSGATRTARATRARTMYTCSTSRRGISSPAPIK